MKNAHRIAGWSLTELLCVIMVISILAAVYPGVIAGAFAQVNKSPAGFSCRHPEPALTC
jgi:prepilin-type N-terminal cleavage/methylation domain-containing protein